MDKSKLPNMVPGKVVPTPRGRKKKRPAAPSPSGPRGGVGGVLDAIKERKRRQQEALDL